MIIIWEGRVSFLFLLFFVMVSFREFSPIHGIQWLSLREDDVFGLSASTEETVSDQGSGCGRAKSLGVKPCAALIHVAKAAALAKNTCKLVNANRRWNCSSIDLAPDFTPELLLGTKEQSFVYALSSAALTYTMARACSSGTLFSCTCGNPPRKLPNGNFKWGGCSDNVKWAGRFVRHFIEAQEKKKHIEKEAEKDEKDIKAKFNTTDFSKIPKHDNTSLIIKRSLTEQSKKAKKKKGVQALNPIILDKRIKKLQQDIQQANSENSKAGRKMAENSLVTQCKCHGVSGSCSIRTCWRRLSPLEKTADEIWQATRAAIKIAYLKNRHRIAKRSSSFSFVTESSNYCMPNPPMGSLGTYGRSCNGTSRTSEDSCRRMCCGRGFRSIVNETTDRCNCRYVWCCRVECDTCRTTTETHYCN